jgi:hypothetical protein
VTSSILKRNINLKMDLLVFEILNKSVVCREPMPLLSFKGGI